MSKLSLDDPLYKEIPAYVVTNEDLRSQTQVFPDAKKVLTVTGSGDQPLFYKLSGATHIDTFDITPNAAAIMEIKIAALKVLKRNEYIEMLDGLNRWSKFYPTIPHIEKIYSYLSKTTRDSLNPETNMGKFSAGLCASAYIEHIPTDAEYAKLATIIEKTFNFIHSPLDKLHNHLTGQYDVINISNIFDATYNGPEQGQILYNLGHYLVPNGHIIYAAQAPKYDYTRVKMEAANDIRLEYEQTIRKNRIHELIIFKRTR